MTPLVLCSLTIIITLITSGIAKAKTPSATGQAIVNLKLDAWISPKLASQTVHWAELALAAWLLFAPGLLGVLGALAALILFLFYWVVIARAVATGNKATCNCFGASSQAPVSGYTLGRNTALLAAALGTLIASVYTGNSVLGMLAHTDGSGWLWLLGAATACAALWCIYRSELLAPSTTDQEALDPNDFVEFERTPIPFGVLTTQEGTQYRIQDLAQAKARVLFFVSPTCSPCQEVIEHIPGWQEKLPMLGMTAVISFEDYFSRLELPENIEIYLDENNTLGSKWGQGTPMAVALGTDGLMAGGPVFGAQAVKDFMDDILSEFGTQ